MPALWAADATHGEVWATTIDGCRPKNPLNNTQGFSRGAVFGRAAERKALRQAAYWHTLATVRPAVRAEVRSGRRGVTVTLVRHCRLRYDSDGWVAAAKPLRDGVADAFGVDDSVSNIDWQYAQVKGKGYAVTILIRERA
jgi:hypothetical protein